MKIVAFDISLAKTGYASWTDAPNEIKHGILPPPDKMKGMTRFCWIHNKLCELACDADLVLMEGLSFGSRDKDFERAGVSWCFRRDLWKKAIPYVLIAPASGKKFCTGSGKAEKSMVLREVFRRFAIEAQDDNDADAACLLMMGLALTSQYPPNADCKPLTEVQKESVAKLKKANLEVFPK